MRRATVATTNQEITAALEKAREFSAGERRAIRAEYEKKPDLISLYMSDGVRVSIPRTKLEGLQGASTAQLSKIEILGQGTGLHWPLLDVDHYVPGLMNAVFGTQRWMAEVGRRGGLTKSKSKAAAARANGKKGGRPKRQAA